VVQLIDSRHPPMDSDVDLIERLRDVGVPHLIALTKADKLSGNGRAQAERRMDECLSDLDIERPVLLTSAKTNRDVGKLRHWIVEQVKE
jgi:GTP-binding protein